MKNRKALITGIAGFAGSHLAQELLDNNYQLFGTYLKGESLENISQIKSRLTLLPLDITSEKSCIKVIERIKPNYLFHLAAFSSVGLSFGREEETYKINIFGTLNLLKANLSNKHLKKFIFISSSDCYGNTGSDKAIKETTRLNPRSPYAISKVTAEEISLYYHSNYKMPVVISRSFNHTGPRQNGNFVIPSFSRQIAEIEKGKKKPVMTVGDLSTKRDFSDVRDIVRGYRLMAEKGKVGEIYNLSSQKSVSIREILDILLSFSEKSIKVKTDKKKFRKNDIPVIKGSNYKAVKELGFKRRYTLKTTLKDSLNFWREKLK